MKFALIFNQGLGDSLFYVPLMNAIRDQSPDHRITGLFDSDFNCEELFQNTPYFDQIYFFKNTSKIWLFSWIWKHYKKYDYILLNRQSSALRWLVVSSVLSKKVLTLRKHPLIRILPAVKRRIIPIPCHAMLEPLKLFVPSAGIAELRQYFFLKTTDIPDESPSLKAPYMTCQVSAANNLYGYKNWPAEHWSTLFRLLYEQYPNIHLILLGDENEVAIGKNILRRFSHPSIENQVGKCSLKEAISTIQNARAHIGLDSGLLHLAALLGKPTFSIWGATSPLEFGYSLLDPKRHYSFYHNPGCAPCHSFQMPNRSRVTHPLECPDYRCIREISPLAVFPVLCEFLENNNLA